MGDPEKTPLTVRHIRLRRGETNLRGYPAAAQFSVAVPVADFLCSRASAFVPSSLA
jgi:hypothetical protein